MRTTVLILSAAALVAPAVALHNTANGDVPVAGGVMNNKLGVAERATPDYNAAAPPPYAPPESASPSPASETNVHKRQAPNAPVPVPTPAGVPPSHVIPTAPVQPPVQTPVGTVSTTTSTTTTVSSATATATHTAMRLAHPVVNHAVEPHHANIGRRALEIATDAGHDVVRRARDILAARPAGVKREILVAIREALSDLDKLGLTGAPSPQNDALAAEKHASNSHEDETVNMHGVDFTHNLDPLSTDDERVPEEEQEAEPTYSSDV